jgi:L-xylulokinase
VPAGETSVIFHPYLYGSGLSTSARAGFYGLAGWHTRAHLLRALYEGVVFNHLDHIERLNRAGLDFEVARLAGGGAQSEVWAQMLADALAKPVEIAEGAESGTRGAALAAGIGAGIYADYEDAVRRGVRLARRFEPDLHRHAIYSERYAEYKHLGNVMAGPWERLSRLEGSYKE